MNERNEEMAPEAPKADIPQVVADDLAALARDLGDMERSAAAGAKTTAVVFILLLAVIVGYLYLWPYKMLKEHAKPDEIVALGMNAINDVMIDRGLPRLDSAELGKQIADKLKAAAPKFVADRLRPELEKLSQRLPEEREKLTKQITERAPEYIDDAMDRLRSEWIPDARKQVIGKVTDMASESLDKLETELRSVVVDVIHEHKANMRDLEKGNRAKLQKQMEASFEEKLGPLMDQVFEGIEAGLVRAKDGLADLVAKQETVLTEEEQLEIRLIQLVYTLIYQKASQPQPQVEPLGEQIEEVLSKDLSTVE